MTTKSKHKPVTLAKSVADFAVSETHDADFAETLVDGANAVSEKPVAKSAKAPKTKAAQDNSAHDVAAIGSDVIGVYRNLAERSLDHARQTFFKARDEAQVISGKLEETSSAIADGTSAVQSYVVKAIQTQADEFFSYVRAFAEVKTMSDAIALQSTQSRKALASSLRQFKDLSAMVNDMAVKASTPLRSQLSLDKH